MKNSLFNKTLLILFLTIALFSCQAQRPLFNIYQTQHWTFPFGEGFDKVLYKGSLDIKDKHLTGLLLAKRSSDTTVRIVFSNEMGMMFFDVEFTGEKTRVHYIFPSMDKKAFISILTDDLKMIFVDDFTITGFKKETREETIYYTLESSRGKTFYTVDIETFRIMNMSTTGKKVRKTIINYEYSENPFPAVIRVDNPFIGMKIRLNLLSEK